MLIADAVHKTDRLEQIKILFRRRPEGVGTAEIARLLGVSQRTARRYVKELSEHRRLPMYREGRVWRLEEVGHIDLPRIQLNLDEALSLYLAARMLSACSDKHEGVEVKLRFSRRALSRVNEPDWPGVVAREEDPEGRCTLTFRVNHVLEIKSWIRAWGPECEVLAPEEFRREIAEEMETAAGLYSNPRDGRSSGRRALR